MIKKRKGHISLQQPEDVLAKRELAGGDELRIYRRLRMWEIRFDSTSLITPSASICLRMLTRRAAFASPILANGSARRPFRR